MPEEESQKKELLGLLQRLPRRLAS